MSFRRRPHRVAAEHDWRRFVERNAPLVAASGLPSLATASVTAWDDLLTLGYLPGDPGGFGVKDLSPSQYASLVHLTTSYFAMGYEFYTPTALRLEDQAALRARFAGER